MIYSKIKRQVRVHKLHFDRSPLWLRFYSRVFCNLNPRKSNYKSFKWKAFYGNEQTMIPTYSWVIPSVRSKMSHKHMLYFQRQNCESREKSVGNAPICSLQRETCNCIGSFSLRMQLIRPHNSNQMNLFHGVIHARFYDILKK